MNAKLRDRILLGIGLFGIVGFLYLYAVKLFGQHGKPVTIAFLEGYLGRGGLIVLNALIFASFLALLPYRVRHGQRHWKSKGAFVGFLIALFTEMFGLPLVVYLFSPFFDYPFILPLSRKVMGALGMVAGTWLTLAGILLVFFGWRRVYRASGLVTKGLYGYVRHPQYCGLFLIILGWLLHWPSLLTLMIAPVLIVVYYRLSIREEHELEAIYGTEYAAYSSQTHRFVPRFRRTRSRAGARS